MYHGVLTCAQADRARMDAVERAVAAEAQVDRLTARLKAAKEVTGIFEADWKQELARNEVLTARLTEADELRDALLEQRDAAAEISKWEGTKALALPYVAALDAELEPLTKDTAEWFNAISRHVDGFWKPLRARKQAADEAVDAALARAALAGERGDDA